MTFENLETLLFSSSCGFRGGGWEGLLGWGREGRGGNTGVLLVEGLGGGGGRGGKVREGKGCFFVFKNVYI